MREMFGKICGKIVTYMGILMAIAGLVWENFPLFLTGVIILIIGCIWHEVNEK